jgi:hypothetical protein
LDFRSRCAPQLFWLGRAYGPRSLRVHRQAEGRGLCGAPIRRARSQLGSASWLASCRAQYPIHSKRSSSTLCGRSLASAASRDMPPKWTSPSPPFWPSTRTGTRSQNSSPVGPRQCPTRGWLVSWPGGNPRQAKKCGGRSRL